jgi:hypothetical protein
MKPEPEPPAHRRRPRHGGGATSFWRGSFRDRWPTAILGRRWPPGRSRRCLSYRAEILGTKRGILAAAAEQLLIHETLSGDELRTIAAGPEASAAA